MRDRGGGRSKNGHGGRGGRGGQRARGDTVDIFADGATGVVPGPAQHSEPRYSLCHLSRSQNQPSVSDWLIGSQSQSQHASNEQRDNDLESEISEHCSEPTETDDIDGTSATALLLEIRRDVKCMNKTFDHLEKSVRVLKHDSKYLKEQNSILTKQVTELQSNVSQLESRTHETEIKNERLEAQSRRDNLKFHRFEDNRKIRKYRSEIYFY